MSESVYASDGVDFAKEHDVVGLFKALYQATKAFTDDLKAYGFEPPANIGYFSDAVVLDTEKLYKATGGGKIALTFGMDGAGTKPRAHLAHLQITRSVKEAKSKVAKLAKLSRECVGIDTIAMVANDLICGGARPAYILDYVAWHDPSVEVARDLVAGLYIGASQSGSTVVGGENASLSEMISGYDICATATGFVLNPKHIEHPLTGDNIDTDDVIIGIGSSGLHCNGISTARKKLIFSPVLKWMGRYHVDEVVPELGKTAAEEILTPTIIYKQPVLDGILNDERFDVKAVANVTGEGIGNLTRALERSKGFGARINLGKGEKVTPHPVFGLIQREGQISDREMWEVYNMGIGMYMIAPRDQADAIVGRLERYKVGDEKIRASVVGEIIEEPNHKIILRKGKLEEVF